MIAHGGRLDAAIAEFGGSRDTWLDLSTGINPNPYSVGMISVDAWARLPDQGDEGRLISAARVYYGTTDQTSLVMANGTQAIIERLPQLLGLGKIGIVSPTYGEHAHVWRKAGASVVEVGTLDDLPKGLDALVVVNPNNPDCRVWNPKALHEASLQVGALIVDEAFCDPTPEMSLVSELPENALVLKSFGKFFGLAGLRLGFAICKPEWALELQDMMGPWAVSGPALEIGAQAYADRSWIENTREQLGKASSELAGVLEEGGFEIKGVNPLFVYARHDDAKRMIEHLSKEHILVRGFENMPDVIRFGLCKNSSQLQRLSQSLMEFSRV